MSYLQTISGWFCDLIQFPKSKSGLTWHTQKGEWKKPTKQNYRRGRSGPATGTTTPFFLPRSCYRSNEVKLSRQAADWEAQEARRKNKMAELNGVLVRTAVFLMVEVLVQGGKLD